MEDEITVSEVSPSSQQTSKLHEIKCGHWIEGHSGNKCFMSSSYINWLAWKKIEPQIV